MLSRQAYQDRYSRLLMNITNRLKNGIGYVSKLVLRLMKLNLKPPVNWHFRIILQNRLLLEVILPQLVILKLLMINLLKVKALRS